MIAAFRSILALSAASALGWPAAAGASMVTEFGPPARIAFMDRSGVVHEISTGITPDGGPSG
jgi:hypothetical protein